MKKILFVCSGNTCRSPLAEGIAKKLLVNSQQPAYAISSAGSSALDGLPASVLSTEVAHSNSIDLTRHRARLLSRALVREADLIVVMGENHRDTVGIIDPSALDYTCRLTDFCDEEDGDITDPVGQGRDVYEATFRRIEKCIASMKTRLGAFEGWKKTKEG